MDRAQLESLDREGLVARAQAAGIKRARILTRPELVDELLRLDPTIDETALKRSRGFFGRARDLLSRVVERGLHLPDAAERLRAALTTPLPDVPRPEPQAIPTVTLAEIYAAQGHVNRAIETLERVLEREPDHRAAQTLLARLQDSAYVPPREPMPPEPEIENDGPGAHLGTVPPLAATEEETEDETEDETEEEFRPSLSTAATIARAPECVAIPKSGGGHGGRAYVWWRVAEEMLGGPFVVYAVVLEPTWDGPRESVRQLNVEPATGEIVLDALPEPAVVRVAVGFTKDGAFVPVAHSPALEIEPRGGTLLQWTLEGPVPVVLDDPRASSIARAVDGARRALGP